MLDILRSVSILPSEGKGRLKFLCSVEAYTSGGSQNKYAALRNVLLRMMMPSQSAEGQQRVREWMDAFDVNDKAPTPPRARW